MHSSEIWNRVSGILAREFRITTLDLPGFGASAPLSSTHISLSSYARMLHAALNELAKENEISAVVADSLSTTIVAIACQIDPKSLPNRLLLSGCPFDGLPLLLRVLPVSLLLRPALWLLRSLRQDWRQPIINLFAKYTVHNWTRPVTEISYGVLHADPATAQGMFNALKQPIQHSAANCLARHKCVLLRGEFDRIVSRSSMTGWAGNICAKYVELPNSGHTPMIEEPERYARAIRELMQ
jgi:pimeloyl-ACP methyl ester carboxylesterase